MPIRTKVPESLRALLPEEAKDTIIIGSEAYEIVPLPAAKAELMMEEFIEIITVIFGDIMVVMEGGEHAASIPDLTKMGEFLKKGFSTLLDGKRVQKLVSIAADIPFDTVCEQATVHQLYHALGIIWKQNLTTEEMPDDSRKNFECLLVQLGLRDRDDPVYQWADAALRVLTNSLAGSCEERIAAVVRDAIALNILKPGEERELLSKGFMPSSPAPTDSPASTSTESGGYSVPSPANPVPKDTGSPAATPAATVGDMPSGDSTGSPGS